MKRLRRLLAVCAGGYLSLWPHAGIAAPAAQSVAELRAELAALTQEQEAAIAKIRGQTQERVAAIEAALTRLAGGAPFASAPTTAPTAAAPAKPLQVSGDFRLRFEDNLAAGDIPARSRGVLRARLGARYDVNDWLSIGGRLATGDPDDPNSTDVTLSDFADDLAVSLDLAFLRVRRGNLELYGGKIPNPFTRTELVWDGDVNPEGLSAAWSHSLPGGFKARLSSLYSLINEQSAGTDSSMVGTQLGLAHARATGWSFDLAAAYYDYTLAGLAGADAGDIRSNLLAPGGARYLSDFKIVDGVVSASYVGSNPAWPVKVTAEVVKNTGAATAADSGYALDLSWGRTQAPHDARINYGYAVAETDAVFAAFSHDNTTFATNYRQHALGVDYVPWPYLVLNGTWYHYRPDDPGIGGAEWLDRIRFNFLVQF